MSVSITCAAYEITKSVDLELAAKKNEIAKTQKEIEKVSEFLRNTLKAENERLRETVKELELINSWLRARAGVCSTDNQPSTDAPVFLGTSHNF
ncbi:MAG: hypothetical protein COB04_16265 [Gammaproteobacteria bacterium]|nr:MAG: hypothetical protein COB04_16265 [Gammaproteobacteria bacterium]